MKDQNTTRHIMIISYYFKLKGRKKSTNYSSLQHVTLEINKDCQNENKQRLFIQSLLYIARG